jgi:hypothetical protein
MASLVQIEVQEISIILYSLNRNIKLRCSTYHKVTRKEKYVHARSQIYCSRKIACMNAISRK